MWHDVVSWVELQQRSEYGFQLKLPHEPFMLEGFLIWYDEQPYAYQNRCPHQQVSLNWNPHQFWDREQRFIQCSTHGALFEPENGVCVHGPCLDDTLVPFQVRIKEGQVQVCSLSPPHCADKNADSDH